MLPVPSQAGSTVGPDNDSVVTSRRGRNPRYRRLRLTPGRDSDRLHEAWYLPPEPTLGWCPMIARERLQMHTRHHIAPWWMSGGRRCEGVSLLGNEIDSVLKSLLNQ